MMNQAHHLKTIAAHAAFDETEAAHQQAMLTFVERYGDFYKRTLSVGHVTSSAWIIDPTCCHALMLHHKKLNRWLQPGGHVEDDATVLESALREAQEETGIAELRTVSDAIFDIDIHTIPANKREAAHPHFDIRYLFEASLDDAPEISDESNEVRWFTLEEIASINSEASIQRMILKTVRRQQ